MYVMLHKNSIEEMMFDKLGNKEDAATICLHGKRVPRDVKVLGADEVLAEHVTGYDNLASGTEDGESYIEKQWETLLNNYHNPKPKEELVNVI